MAIDEMPPARAAADRAHNRLLRARREFLTCPADDTHSAKYRAVVEAQAAYDAAREAEWREEHAVVRWDREPGLTEAVQAAAARRAS